MLLHQNEVITMHLTRRLKPYLDFFENMILLLYFTLSALMVRLFLQVTLISPEISMCLIKGMYEYLRLSGIT